MADSTKHMIRKALSFGGAEQHRREWSDKNKLRRDAELLLENISGQRVFFYPGAGHDWEPLHRLTHLCDTFIFCDWVVSAKSVIGDFKLPGLTTDFIGPLHNDIVEHLSDRRQLPPNIRNIVEGFGHAPVEPWGKYARLTRTVGDVTRTIHFFYLGMDGITAFFNLFIPDKFAPQVICLKFGMDPNGQHFHWQGPLGQLVQECRTHPTHVVGCGGPRGTWPYPRLWQDLHGWSDVWVKENYQPEIVSANPLGGPRRVIVKRGTLKPDGVLGCKTLVLPMELYRKHRDQWPAHARIMLLAPADQAGQLQEPDDRLVFLGVRRAPLEQLLDSLTQKCADLGIESVASIGIGHEDEGPELDKWRRQEGPPLELTIFCEEEGDVVSLGPWADEIQG